VRNRLYSMPASSLLIATSARPRYSCLPAAAYLLYRRTGHCSLSVFTALYACLRRSGAHLHYRASSQQRVYSHRTIETIFSAHSRRAHNAGVAKAAAPRRAIIILPPCLLAHSTPPFRTLPRTTYAHAPPRSTLSPTPGHGGALLVMHSTRQRFWAGRGAQRTSRRGKRRRQTGTALWINAMA